MGNTGAAHCERLESSWYETPFSWFACLEFLLFPVITNLHFYILISSPCQPTSTCMYYVYMYKSCVTGFCLPGFCSVIILHAADGFGNFWVAFRSWWDMFTCLQNKNQFVFFLHFVYVGKENMYISHLSERQLHSCNVYACDSTVM